MAVIIWGKSKCTICHRPLRREERVMLIPAALYGNPESALHYLHDAGVHEACLEGVSQYRSIKADIAAYRQFVQGERS